MLNRAEVELLHLLERRRLDLFDGGRRLCEGVIADRGEQGDGSPVSNDHHGLPGGCYFVEKVCRLA